MGNNIAAASIAFSLAFFISVLLVWLIRQCAPKIGLVDQPEGRKFHSRTMPLGGGIALIVSVGVAYLVGYIVWQPAAGGRELLIIFGGGLAIAIAGLIDDFHDLRPGAKIAVQTMLAVVLFFYGIRITLFIESYVLSFLMTWAWFFLITNAFNLLDNMDGLSGGVAFISGAIFFVVAVQTRQWEVVFMLAGFLGGILGFLCYNFPPASIFMGDCGSLFIGYLMAVLTIHATFYQVSGSVFPIALPLLVMAVPLFDTSTVVWIRLRERRPIFKGDTRHFSHRLVHLGMTPRQAVLTIYLITFSTGISATLLYQINLAGGVIIIVQILAILAAIHIIEQAGSARNSRH